MLNKFNINQQKQNIMQKFIRTLMLVALLLPFASQAQNTLTVADGTATNSNVPIHGLYVDDFTRCQIIYPASEIEASAQAYGMTGTFGES